MLLWARFILFRTMKRDHLATLSAGLALLLCGYGVGFVFGERKALSGPRPPLFTIPESKSTVPWKEETLEKLSAELSLNSFQKKRIAEELEISARDFILTYNESLGVLHRLQRQLRDRIIPHLTPEQIARIQAVE